MKKKPDDEYDDTHDQVSYRYEGFKGVDHEQRKAEQ